MPAIRTPMIRIIIATSIMVKARELRLCLILLLVLLLVLVLVLFFKEVGNLLKAEVSRVKSWLGFIFYWGDIGVNINLSN